MTASCRAVTRTADRPVARTARRPRRSTPSSRVPGSKSLTNRALVLAALADGPDRASGPAARPRHPPDGARRCASLGVGVEAARRPAPTTRLVACARGRCAGRRSVDCGLAGTVMRFVPPVAALADGPTSLRRRPARAAAAARRRARARCATLGRRRRRRRPRRRLPFTVHGHGSRRAAARSSVDAAASSQFVTALLLAGARFDDGLRRRGTAATRCRRCRTST